MVSGIRTQGRRVMDHGLSMLSVYRVEADID